MFDFLIRLYYKTPHIRWYWRNPIRFEKRDSRSVDWFNQRRKYGFDETELWNLGSNLHDRICKRMNIKLPEHENMKFEQFKSWFTGNDTTDLKWFQDRFVIYIKWECPTFYMDKDHNSYSATEQKKIVNRMSGIINRRMLNMKIDDIEIHYLYKKIFHIGW